MGRPIIEVRNLSKVYRLGTIGATRLKDDVERLWKRLRGSEKREPKGEFWALRDVSLEVQPGEVVGIIGRNGAGKSTLLKILSRITQQTRGEVVLRGRVSSLLEVGTGFHPDLSGGENIFLNGAILGMTKAEIRAKFDAIVDFAGIHQFVDTPVKRYSSGMHVRLAFAVAAHLEPEILIVDEVLAVGDAEFQRKCLGKMEEVSRNRGRTVLFVSHNLFAVRSLCTRAVLLENGRLTLDGDVNTALSHYAANAQNTNVLETHFDPDPKRPSITRVALDRTALDHGDLVIDIEFESPFEVAAPIAGAVLFTASGVPVFGSNPRFHKKDFQPKPMLSGVTRLTVQDIPLIPAAYRLSVWLGEWHLDYDHKPYALAFDFEGNERETQMPHPDTIGALNWPARWSFPDAANGTQL